MNEQNSEHPDTTHVPSPPGQGTDLVKVRYWSETKGEFVSATAYTYRSEDRLAVGDLVMVPVKKRTMKAKVTEVDVPEAETINFVGGVRTIPAGSRIVDRLGIKIEGGGENEFRDINFNTEGPTGAESPTDSGYFRKDEVPTFDPEPLPTETTLDVGDISAVADTSLKVIPIVDPRTRTDIMELVEPATRMLEIARTVVITDNKGLENVTNDLAILVTIKRRMEQHRKNAVEPLVQEKFDIDAAFKDLGAPILEAIQILNGLSTAYRQKVTQQIAEAHRIEEEKLKLAQDEAKLKEGEITVDLEPVEAPAESPEVVRTDLGTTSMRDNWRFEVIDFAALPDAFKIADTAQLNAIARSHHDQKPVPGVRFYNEPVPVIRPRG